MVSIKKYRGLRNMSQTELADKIDISRQYMSTLESKEATITVKQALKIAKALEISPVMLYEMDNFKVKPTTREEKEFIIKLLQDSIDNED